MIALLKKIGLVLRLLSPTERRGMAMVFLGMLLTGAFEVAGVGSVVPFLAVAGNPGLVESNAWVKGVYDSLGFHKPQDFIAVLGLGVIAFLLIANTIKAIVYWLTVRFTKLRMVSLTSRLFRHFLLQPYFFFLDKNVSDLIKSMLEDLPQVLDSVLDPLLDMLSKLVIVIGLIALILVTNPIAALSVSAALGVLYLVLFLSVRKSISRRGELSNQLLNKRIRTVVEAFGGVKEVKFSGTEEGYLSQYGQLARKQFLNDASRDIFGAFPRYFLEVVAFGSVIGVVLGYILAGQGIAEILPLLGLYTFAGYRLLPYLQQIYLDVVKMRYAAARVDAVIEAFASGEPVQTTPKATVTPLEIRDAIQVRNLTFRYPNSEKAVLDGFSVEIPVKSTVGLVGFSGAGKSTFVDLLLGLLDLPRDSVFLDGRPLDRALLPSWKAKIGYVPQTIFLSDTSLAANIAFGVPVDQIDLDRVEHAAKLANLHEFVQNELPNGYDTVTGERGVRLSGGQRQRVGIARALYRNPEVLILDEATSALDGVTEAAIMDRIHKLGHSMTILIIAHRLTTLKECDRIFVLEAGKVVETGTYASLIESNAQFRKMAGQGKKA